MYKLDVLPLAKLDIKESSLWYEEKRKGLGLEFIEEVEEYFKFILKKPKANQIRFKKTRFCLLKRFSYAIHYTIIEKEKTIVVSAVFHTSENPSDWKKRK